MSTFPPYPERPIPSELRADVERVIAWLEAGAPGAVLVPIPPRPSPLLADSRSPRTHRLHQPRRAP